MNKIIILIIVLLAFSKEATSQRITLPLYISDTVYLDLTHEQKQHIRMQHIQHHINYLDYYYNYSGGWLDKVKKRRICKRLRLGFVEFDKIFNPSDLKPSEMPDSIYNHLDSAFFIWPYQSMSFHYPWRNIIVYRLEEEEGIPYNLTSVIEKEFRHINIRLKNEDSVYNNYILCWIYEHIFKTKSIIAINESDYSDVLFISGSLLPLTNFTPEILNQLYNPKSEYRYPLPSMIRHNNSITGRLISNMTNLGIPDTEENYKLFLGIMGYAQLNSTSLYNKTGPTAVKVIDYKKGYYTVELFYNCENIKCKRAYPDDIYFQSHLIGSGCPFFFPSKICNDFDGRSVCRLHVKINPSTGSVKFKIAETVNLKNVPERSKRQ